MKNSEKAPEKSPLEQQLAPAQPASSEHTPTNNAQTGLELDALRWRVLHDWQQHLADQEMPSLLPRGPSEIGKAEKDLVDIVWHYRCHRRTIEEGPSATSPEIRDTALKAAAEIETRIGKENLGPFTDFEWGMINGKLSALRWILGDEWDYLDT